MKINAVKAFILVSLVIIVFYTLGLFLPIIKNTKDSKIHLQNKIIVVFDINKNNSTKLHGL